MLRAFYSTQFFGEWGVAEEALKVEVIFFSYPPVFGKAFWFSLSNPKNIFFREGSPGNEHSRLANQSLIISSSNTTFWLVSPLTKTKIKGLSILPEAQMETFNHNKWARFYLRYHGFK